MRTRRLITGIIAITVIAASVAGGIAYRIFAASASYGSGNNNLRQPIADTNGLVAWYPFDGNASDLSGNNDNGTPALTGANDGYVTGKFGKGLQLNGITDVVSLGVDASTANLSTQTYSFWLYMSSYPSASSPGYVFRRLNQMYVSSTGGLTFSSSTWSGQYGQWFTSSGAIPLNTWVYVVITYDGSSTSNNPSFYINGSSVSGTQSYIPSGTITSDSTTASYIGNTSALNRGFPGIIDDFRIYNRVLSTAEIGSLYAGSPPSSCDQTCVSWLKFDDNAGNTAADSSGSGNAGNLNGTTTWTTGDFASALNLNGSTGYVSLPNLGLTSGTVEMWIDPTSVTGDQHLFTQLSGSSTQAGQIDMNQSSGESGSLWVWNGTAWQRLSAAGSIQANAWNQVVVTNSGGTATAYINGVQQQTAAAAFAFSGSAAGIGAKFLGTTGGTFNGTVDDFRAYSRILAPEEIADQYRQGS